MNVKTMFNKTVLVLRKNSPKILVGSSIVSGVGAVVLAVKATPKAVEVITNHKETRAWYNELNKNHLKFNENTNAYEDYPVETYKKDVRKLYVKTSAKLLKLYAPAGLCLTASISSTIASHNIMNGRNKALTNQLASAAAQAAAYRSRVKEVLGEEKEQELWDNVKEKEVVNSQGKKEKVAVKDDNHSQFSILFSESCRNWEPNATLNVEFLLGAEQYFTDKLRHTGVLFLDEVYKYIGVDIGQIGNEKMKLAHMVGWVYDKNNPMFDGYVSFGLHDSKGHLKRWVMDQEINNEPCMWLDFNVCGDIVNQSYDYTNYITRPF